MVILYLVTILQHSIIIPTHNREKILPGTIENILKQTHVNWELIIVDDGSSDETVAVLKEKSKEHQHIFYLELSSF